MKINDKLFQFFILIAMMTSIISLEATSWSMNFFLLPSIAFTFSGFMIFLVHEKHIINNFMRTYKRALKAALTAALFFFAVYTSLHTLSAGAAFLIVSAAYTAFRHLKKKNYILLFISALPLALAYFIPAYKDNITVKILMILASFSGETALMFMLREVKDEFTQNPKETLCFANLTVAVISVPLFFITKSDTAAILSKTEQVHLFLITFIYTFLVSSLAIIKPNSLRLDRKVFIFAFIVSASVISLFSFSLFFIAGALILAVLLFFQSFKKEKRGMAITEFMAILTLSSILISMVFPVYSKIKSEINVRNDKRLYEEGRQNEIEDAIKIGGYFIKSADNQIKFIYKTNSEKFTYFTAE
ncbi:MAG: hypothetical protein AB7T10_07240 [bacterium]